MKKINSLIFIHLLLCSLSNLYAQQVWTTRAFSKLTSSKTRIDFINQTFSQTNLVGYDSLLAIIQSQKDHQTELFWHHRKHISLSIFPLSLAEKEQNLQEMRQKAQKYQDKAAELVANLHIDFLKYEQKKYSTVELYYKNLSSFDEMKKIGFSTFRVYDLNLLLWRIGKDLGEYWQADKGLDFLLIAEQNPQTDTVGQYYHTEVLCSIRGCYLQDHDLDMCNVYSQKILAIHQAINPQEDPKLWRDLFWQAKANLEIATVFMETSLSWEKTPKIKITMDYTKQEQLEKAKTFAAEGIRLYKNRFDLQTATHEQIMSEWDILEYLTIFQISLGRVAETKLLLERMEAIKKALNLEQSDDFLQLWGLYRDYEQYYLAQNDYKSAYPYKLKMEDIEDQVYDRNAKNQLDEMKQVHQIDKYNVQIQTIEKEKKQQQYLIIAAFLITIIVSISAYMIYRRIKKDKDTISLQKELLENALKVKETLLKEIHHRVKNNLQIISALLEKQAMKTTDELAKKLIKEGQNRVFSMALVHQNLYQSENLSSIEIKSYLEVLTQNIHKSHANQQQEISLDLQADNSVLNVDTVIPLGLILNELVTNCYKYAFNGREKGKIEVVFTKEDNKFTLLVADDGIGMPAHLDIKKLRSLGLSLVNGLVMQLDGVLTFEASEKGTRFLISCSV